MKPSEPFDDLERELSGRGLPEPRVGFRRQVESAMRAELQRQAVSRAPSSRWQFVGLTAAAVLLAINFSMSVANDADFEFQARMDRASLAATAAELRDLAPELSEDEAVRHALFLRAGSGTVAMPEPLPWTAAHLSEMEPK